MLSEQAHGYSPINIMTFSTQVYVKCTDRVSFSELVHPETIGLIYSVVMIFRRTVNPFSVYPSSFFFSYLQKTRARLYSTGQRTNSNGTTIYNTFTLRYISEYTCLVKKKTSKKDSFRIATLYFT